MTEEGVQELPSIPELHAKIRARFGTVHRFCKLHKGRLCRSAVYMTLNETYTGSRVAQALRIAEALGLAKSQKEQALAAIKEVACGRCEVKARPCERCDGLFRAQAAAVARVFSG